MPVYNCPVPNCTFATEDVADAVAAVFLILHNNFHKGPTPAPVQHRKKVPQLDRPRIAGGSTEETWNTFSARWTMFKNGHELTDVEKVQHLFQCCDEELGDTIIKGHPNAASGTEQELLAIVKKLAVIPVAISVRRSDLLSTKQAHGETGRSFYARLKGKAATCAYTINCSEGTCARLIDFTNVIVKDVLINGLADEEIKKDVLGWIELDTKGVEDVVSFVESKEMARDALLNKHSTPAAAAVSSYRKEQRSGKPKEKSEKLKGSFSCPTCNVEVDKFVWNQRQGKFIEVKLCHPCWKKSIAQKKPKNGNRDVTNAGGDVDETGALLIG